MHWNPKLKVITVKYIFIFFKHRFSAYFVHFTISLISILNDCLDRFNTNLMISDWNEVDFFVLKITKFLILKIKSFFCRPLTVKMKLLKKIISISFVKYLCLPEVFQGWWNKKTNFSVIQTKNSKVKFVKTVFVNITQYKKGRTNTGMYQRKE